jgi:protein-disulfide isomerase
MANSNNKPDARSKAAAARAAQQAAERRRRQLVITGCVVAAIVVLVGVGILIQHGKSNSGNSTSLGAGPVVTPSGAVGTDGLAIPFGGSSAAKVDLTIYEDYRCPICKLAESELESVYKPLAEAGKIQVLYHSVNLIDRNDGGTGSIRAGSAAACAQTAGKFEPYHDVLYANQPDETDDAFGSTGTLTSLAKQVPGLDTPAFDSCVDATRYGSWVVANFNSLSKILGGSVATPYYAINGKQYMISGASVAAAQTAFAGALDAAIAAG